MRLATPVVIQIDDFDRDLKFNCRLDEHIGSQIYWCGSYSRGELVVLDRLLEDGMIFFDVGANQGEFTVFAAKRLPRGRVFALEPMSQMYEMLISNISLNGFQNVDPMQLALTAAPGHMEMYTSIDRFTDGTINQGLGTLHPTDTRATVIETVECVQLDALVHEIGLERLDLLKLDIEGGEYDAIRGARETLERFAPTMIVEVNEIQTAAGGREVGQLVSLLHKTHDLYAISRNGRLRSFELDDLRGTVNVLCRPRRT